MPGLSAAAVPTAVAVDEGTEVMHGLLNHRSHARHEWDGVALPPTPQHQQVNLKNVAVRCKQATQTHSPPHWISMMSWRAGALDRLHRPVSSVSMVAPPTRPVLLTIPAEPSVAAPAGGEPIVAAQRDRALAAILRAMRCGGDLEVHVATPDLASQAFVGAEPGPWL